MAKGIEKTNVMRILDQKKIEYKAYHFETDGAVSGVEVAKILGLEESGTFKTLVTIGKSKEHYVFVIPVACELDLKKAASASGEKSIEMIAQKELLPLTGYVHGGCSPIGLKKPLKIFVDASAENRESLVFSAGKIGYQVEIKPSDLQKITNCRFAELTV